MGVTRYIAISYFNENSPQHNVVRGMVGIPIETFVRAADHEAALAEKDKEIAKVAGERNQTAKEFDVAYQAAVTYKQQRDTLIAQAVRFAEYIKNSPVSHVMSHVLVKDAQAFLSTPEVQAYQAQQKEGG